MEQRPGEYEHLTDAELEQAIADARNAYRFKPNTANVATCEAVCAEIERRAARSRSTSGGK
jgi:broad specificity phosphatase PhoE